jgi:hypothetical protein
MKNNELNALIKEVLKEEMSEMFGHEDQPDGYSNDYQRAFAHSQATQPRGQSQEKEAEELAKKGKYVVITNDYEHCKSTDAVLGTCVSIAGVFDTAEEAQKKAEELHKYADGVDIISPASVANKNAPKETPPPSTDDDVPFEEGYGMGDMKKDPKKAFDKARWTVKYDESVSLAEVKRIIAQLLLEEGKKLKEDTAPTKNNDPIISSMKDWIKECLPWRDLQSEEEVDELTPDEVLAGVNAHYEGGLQQFYKDSQGSYKQSASAMNENVSGWNPQPLPKDANSIANLIHSLREGIGIFFSYDNKTGHQGDWVHVSCVVEGDYINYRVASNATDKKQLESEDEINELANEVASGGYNFYSIEPLQDYKKSTYRAEDPTGQDDPGEYEINGPDYPKPEYESVSRPLYEAKGKNSREKLRSIIREVLKRK